MKDQDLKISGNYIALKDVSWFKAGHLFDSSDGKIQGVWCPVTKQVIRFDNEEFFEPETILTEEDIEEILGIK